MKKLFFSDKYVLLGQKKLILGLTIVTVVSFLFFTMNSCNKEQVFSGNTEIQSSMSKLTPKERVDYFRAVVDKTQLESRDEGQTYTAEEAVLGVETLLNYDYDDFTKRYNNSDVKRDTITISKNNGVIDDNVIADLNSAVLDIMQCHFANIDSTNKKEMFVDMYNVSENSQEFQVGVTNVVGFFPTVIWPNTATFGPGDDWDAIQGKCDGTSQNELATYKIASYATWNVGINNLELGTWFSDIEYISFTEYPEVLIWFGANPNDPETGDWIIDYFEWWAEFCDDDKWPCYPGNINMWEDKDNKVYSKEYLEIMCIEWDEMNYYLANAEAECLKFEPILNKEFIYLSMSYTKVYQYLYRLSWNGGGQYAKKNMDYSRLTKKLASCNK